jgi:hypothetical protein
MSATNNKFPHWRKPSLVAISPLHATAQYEVPMPARIIPHGGAWDFCSSVQPRQAETLFVAERSGVGFANRRVAPNLLVSIQHLAG